MVQGTICGRQGFQRGLAVVRHIENAGTRTRDHSIANILPRICRVQCDVENYALEIFGKVDVHPRDVTLVKIKVQLDHVGSVERRHIVGSGCFQDVIKLVEGQEFALSITVAQDFVADLRRNVVRGKIGRIPSGSELNVFCNVKRVLIHRCQLGLTA